MASNQIIRPVGRPAAPGRIPSLLRLLPGCCLCGLLSLPILATGVLAQPPDTLWARAFGGSNIDIGHCVAETADGGHIITGYTRSFGEASGRNVWLLKTDDSGHEEWNSAFGGDSDDEGHSVLRTLDGGYVIAGLTNSFGAGMKDVLLIKADMDGDLEWIKTYGGSNDDEGYSVLQTPDGGFVIAGVTSSFGSGSRDIWMIRTDDEGNQDWTRTHGGTGSDGAWSIRGTSDDGFILAGWTFSHGPGYLGNAWLVKTDSLGIHEWNSAFGGSDADRGYSAGQTSDGGYILAGYTGSFGSGLYDMLLIKTDASGQEDWMRTFGGSGRDYAQSVQETADGGYIVAGYTLSYGAGSEDVWLVKTDADGYEDWSVTYGGTSSDVAYCVRQTADAGYVVTGHTLSYGSGLHDVWLLRLAGSSAGVGEVTAGGTHRSYPNPFREATAMRYALSTESDVRIVVHDAAGRQIRTLVQGRLSPGSHSAVWDGRDDSGAPAAGGVYFCRLEAEGTERVGRMVLAR